MITLSTKIAGLAIGLLATSIAIAGNMGMEMPQRWGELDFSAGYFSAHQGRAQHINIDSLVGNKYTLNKKNDQNYVLGGGLFVNYKKYSFWKLSLGFKAFYLAKTDVSGHIIQEDIFDNLAYQYSITQVPLYAMARVMQDNIFQKLTLVADAGIGPNIMHTSNYSERSLDGGITTPDHAFKSHTYTQFSATAGVGLQFKNFIDNAIVEIGYRFFYLGQGSLQPRMNEILDNLKTGHSYANSVIVTVSLMV